MKDLMMNTQPRGFAAGFLRLVLKVFLALISMVFAACLLAVGVLAVLFILIKALITWQKPAPWVAFRRAQKYSSNGQWPGNLHSQTTDHQKPNDLDVVDVEVREVAQEPKRPLK